MTNAAATPAKDTPAPAAGKTGQLIRPKWKEPPRYRLLEKAFLSGVKVQRGRDWMPMDDVLLDPESQPFASPLSGAYGGRGDPERVPLLIEYEGIPDDHMEPANEAAEWMAENVEALKDEARLARQKARGSKRSRNPIDALSLVGPDAAVVRGDSI